eukprot:TRINITY_DN5824_c0_g1_i1.p4 TRINITY_DN5824_c0_g1~~TRINITY_DN5824_c0_g1_i1.p4  ORF type:complete len:53 (+),score=8.66 TRINITY_DN5824_c0_g1_i1:405-563(+)
MTTCEVEGVMCGSGVEVVWRWRKCDEWFLLSCPAQPPHEHKVECSKKMCSLA